MKLPDLKGQEGVIHPDGKALARAIADVADCMPSLLTSAANGNEDAIWMLSGHLIGNLGIQGYAIMPSHLSREDP